MSEFTRQAEMLKSESDKVFQASFEEGYKLHILQINSNLNEAAKEGKLETEYNLDRNILDWGKYNDEWKQNQAELFIRYYKLFGYKVHYNTYQGNECATLGIIFK